MQQTDQIPQIISIFAQLKNGLLILVAAVALHEYCYTAIARDQN